MAKVRLTDVFKRFPSVGDCITHLENIRWHGQPKCPHCGSDRYTDMPKERRYRCNNCTTNYSVTVKTLFHRTHVDLRKWYLLIALVMESRRKTPNVRLLASEVDVNKNTVTFMIRRIRAAILADKEFGMLTKITDEVIGDE